MEYIRGKRLVAEIINDKATFPQCEFCGERHVVMNYTEDKKRVCKSCMSNDPEFEWCEEEN